MTRISIWLMTFVAAVLVGLMGKAISAQDKYTVIVPNGLAFAEFRGYEQWQAVAASQTKETIEVILANPAMIEAYQSGIPGNGKAFPDGSKIAKIHWKLKQSTESPSGTGHDCGYACHTLVKAKDYIFTAYPKR